jgi:hypothetical protein
MTKPKGEFEKFRETWSRQVLADRELDHRAARVASFLVWHLNRETRLAFPSLSTIAAGVGIDRADASKDIDELVARNHLQKRERRRRNNQYAPMLVQHQLDVGETPTPVGVSPTSMLESRESLSSNFKGLSGVTSDIEPLNQSLNLTSDIKGSLATARPTGALARPKESKKPSDKRQVQVKEENSPSEGRSSLPENPSPPIAPLTLPP